MTWTSTIMTRMERLRWRTPPDNQFGIMLEKSHKFIFNPNLAKTKAESLTPDFLPQGDENTFTETGHDTDGLSGTLDRYAESHKFFKLETSLTIKGCVCHVMYPDISICSVVTLI